MFTYHVWTHPKTGEDRIYVNGHRFDNYVRVWFTLNPITNEAVIHARAHAADWTEINTTPQRYEDEVFDQVAAEFGGGNMVEFVSIYHEAA